MRLGILSDTHGHWDAEAAHFFEPCDLILHAGDIGSERVVESIQALHPLRAVYGNIDGAPLRGDFPQEQLLTLEGLTLYLSHITGPPAHYSRRTLDAIQRFHPRIVVGGHSHILRVMFDRGHDLLFINPGAYGFFGPHRVRTAVRLTLLPSGPRDLEVLELPK